MMGPGPMPVALVAQPASAAETATVVRSHPRTDMSKVYAWGAVIAFVQHVEEAMLDWASVRECTSRAPSSLCVREV
jgi:hypothetical protein